MAYDDPMAVAPETTNYDAAVAAAPAVVPPTPVMVMMVARAGTDIDLGIGRGGSKSCAAHDGGSGDER